jgi:hypothetical protein
MHPSKRAVAAATAVLGALAMAAPITTGASAATTPNPLPGWDRAFAAMPASSVPVFAGAPSPVGGAFFVYGGAVINSVVNGASVAQVVNGGAFSSVLP